MTIKEFAKKLKKEIVKGDGDDRFTRGYNLACDAHEKMIDKLLQQAEQERTNFDKMKDELTVEQFADFADINCDFCPFDHLGKCPNPDWDYDCRELVIDWANKRCEE